MLNFTTNDGYLIEKGTHIFYTGDMANCEGLFIVESIEPCNWYEYKITLSEIEGENRKKTLTPTSFDKGPGRRFIPEELRQLLRNKQKSILFANK